MTDRKKEAAMKKIEELRQAYSTKDDAKLFRGMLYGKFGTYKTTIASTMPRPILFHGFDPGGEEIKHMQEGIKDGSIIADTQFAHRSIADAGNVFKEWNKEYEALKRRDIFSFVNSFVVDSFTSLQKLVIDATMESNPKNTNISDKMPFKVPHQRDYGVQDSAMEFIISDFLDLPCHVLVIAHAEEGTDDNEMVYHQPMITGKKLRAKIPNLFNEIYVTRKLGSKGRVYTDDKGMYEAKSRLRPIYGIEDEFKNSYPGEFNITRDILVPAGYATEDTIVDIADPEDVKAAEEKRRKRNK